jgi:hypothetical protein
MCSFIKKKMEVLDLRYILEKYKKAPQTTSHLRFSLMKFQK